jgi:hypothetical protein
MLTAFWLERPTGRDHSEDLGVDGRILITGSYLRETVCKGVDWIHLA